MRAAAVIVLSPLGAFLAPGLLFAPHTAYAAATFTHGSEYPFVSSIALKVGSDFVPLSTKTQENITVVISVDPGPTPGNNIHGSDSHLFTENGSYTFNFVDDFGNIGSSTVTIDNIDRTPPIITIEPFATSSTNQPVVITATANEGTFASSTHTFTENGSFDFVATDEAGNISTSTVVVAHIDTTAPRITLQGDAAMQLRVNSSYVDAGAQAVDAVDGALPIVSTGSVNTHVLGTYVLTYTATDSAGNEASTTRTVEVIRGSSGGGGRGGSSSVVLATAPVGQVLGATTYNFTRFLGRGDTGADVTALQEILVTAGFLKSAPTGYFGSLTQKALLAYQVSRGLPGVGVLGPLTRSVIHKEAIPVSRPAVANIEGQISLLLAQVQILQSRLASL